MEVEAWHGSGILFDHFSMSRVGSGEGAHALGWGLYFSEDRRIAEYNVKRREFEKKGEGFLYRVVLRLDQVRVISLDQPQSQEEREIGSIYESLKDRLGPQAAAERLRGIGVQAVRAYEQELGACGDTLVCLVDNLIEIKARHAFAPPDRWHDI